MTSYTIQERVHIFGLFAERSTTIVSLIEQQRAENISFKGIYLFGTWNVKESKMSIRWPSQKVGLSETTKGVF